MDFAALLRSDWTVVTVLVALVAALMRGWVVPSAWVRQIVADRDGWRAAYERVREVESDRAKAADAQITQQLGTLTQLVQAIRPEGSR
jgi:hypothetical protein